METSYHKKLPNANRRAGLRYLSKKSGAGGVILSSRRPHPPCRHDASNVNANCKVKYIGIQRQLGQVLNAEG